MTTYETTSNGLWQDLRELPRHYWILFSGTLVNRFGHFVIPFLAVYLRQEGYAAWVTGMALAAFGGGALVAGVLGGYLADRIGRKRTIVLSCSGAAVAMLGLSQASGVSALVTASFATGLMSSMYFPASSALLADLVPPRLRVRAFSCQRLAINLGFAAGMATAGFVAQHSFVALFVVDAVTTMVLGLVVLLGLPNGNGLSRRKSGWGVALRHVRRNPRFLRAVFASFCIALVFWQMSSSYGLQVTEGAGFSVKTYGLLLALNGIMIVLLELPLTSFTRRFSPTRVMAAGYLVVGVGMGLNVFGTSMPLLVVSMVVFTVGEMISLPVAHSYVAGLAPDDMRGRYMGLLSVAWSVATMLGPSAGVALFQWNPGVLWIGLLGLSALAGGVILSTRRSEWEQRAGASPAPAGV